MTKAQYFNLSIAAKSRGDNLMTWHYKRVFSDMEITDVLISAFSDIYGRIDKLEAK